MTDPEVLEMLGFEAVCAAHPDCEVWAYLNTAVPGLPEGAACLLVTPKANLSMMTAEGPKRADGWWHHGEVIRAQTRAETLRMYPSRLPRS